MTNEEFAGNVALEVYERAAKLVPVLSDHLEVDGNPMNELQKIALGSLVLQVFVGLESVLESMCRTANVISRFSDVEPFEVSDETIAAWLRGDQGPMQ